MEEKDVFEINTPPPRKPGFFERLGGNAYESFLKSWTQAMNSLREEKEEFKKYEENTKRRLNEDARKYYEKSAELDSREAEIAAKEEELKEKERDLNERLSKVGERERTANKREKTADERENLFKEKENIPEGATKAEATRDLVFLSLLNDLKSKASELAYDGNPDVKRLEDERKALEAREEGIKGALMVVISMYRDLLPKDERQAFSINGKSAGEVLQSLAKSLRLKGPDYTAGIAAYLPESTLQVMRDTFAQINQHFNVKYETDRSYAPDSYQLGLTDERAAQAIIYEKAFEGKGDHILDITGEDTNLRRNKKRGEKTSIEEGIEDFDDRF